MLVVVTVVRIRREHRQRHSIIGVCQRNKGGLLHADRGSRFDAYLQPSAISSSLAMEKVS